MRQKLGGGRLGTSLPRQMTTLFRRGVFGEKEKRERRK
jgi:hypothetical protein